MRPFSVIAVCAFALILVLPATAGAVEFSIFGSLLDTDDLDESYGLGVRVGFGINDNVDFDISLHYFEDFENRFEDVDDPTNVEVGFIPVDFGITWSQKPEGGFTAGGGATYAFVDLGGLEINDMDVPDFGDADDEFGWYVKIGYQAEGGFLIEGMYRDLEVTIEDLRGPVLLFVPEGRTSIPLDMSGYQVNFGWRF